MINKKELTRLKKKSEILLYSIQNLKVVSLLLLINTNVYKKRGEEESFHFILFFMVKKNSFIPVISQEQKEKNPGSIEFQVFNFTNKIRRLTSHFELHPKDYLSERGLHKILGKRKRLLFYLSKKSRIRYKKLINQLNIRESKIR